MAKNIERKLSAAEYRIGSREYNHCLLKNEHLAYRK